MNWLAAMLLANNSGPGAFGYIMMAVVVVIIIFVIVSAITGRKASKKEKEKRKKEVRETIKKYMNEEEDTKNIRIDFEKVYARRGAEYKYRDVFDVIVDVYEPKTNKIVDTKAYEVEGYTTKIDKKNYETTWKVNGALDLDDTKKRIAIAEKEIKLTKEEKKAMKTKERIAERERRQKEKEELAEAKRESKKAKKNNDPLVDRTITTQGAKFVPTRNKD